MCPKKGKTTVVDDILLYNNVDKLNILKGQGWLGVTS